MRALTLFLAAQSSLNVGTVAGQYLLGLGTGDITGPVVETNMMGYGNTDQTDTGLHMRQRARAFIVADQANPTERIVFVNADIGMGDTGVRRSIVAKLATLYPGTGGSSTPLYHAGNLAFVGTHSHAGVGGYLENLIPQVTSLGYVPLTAQAIVTGTVAAIQRAHNSLAAGKLSVGNTTITDGNVNRSPAAYDNNPAAEKARYTDNVDKEMSLLRFDDASGKARGFLSFFAVHGTSLMINNTLVSGDNKGLAAQMYEAMVEPNSLPGSASFVAGFTQSNVGDTSPNTLGAVCFSPGKAWDGQACDYVHSTCGNLTADCWGRGPGYTTPLLTPLADGTFLKQFLGYESNRIIADKQFQGAKTIMNGKLSPVSGNVKSVHIYLNMANHTFNLPNGTSVKTCPAALGYSFAGGTTDGPGHFDFTQGNNGTSQNPFWEIVKGVITPAPSAEQVACQAPKPVLLNTGYAHWPYEWAPSTVDIQMLRVGNFVMLIMPGELTTMAGRRLREAIRAKLLSSGILGNDAYVVIAGPANTYAHYVTTKEEYAIQRYEGASTIFGQWTLDAYIEKYGSLVSYLASNAAGSPQSDAAPADQTGSAISLQTGVVFDAAPIGKKFGQVLIDVKNTAYHVGDTVWAQFVGANPRNDLRLEGTFLSVDQQISGQWKTVRSDSHPSTIFRWERINTILATSNVNISWTIESGTPAGTYRLSYFGNSKPLIGSISSFSGVSSPFTVS